MKIKGSYSIAALITLLLIVWLSSGMLRTGDPLNAEQSLREDKPQAAEPPSVRTRVFQARDYIDTLLVRGISEAKSRLVIKAETAARVIELPRTKGSVVEKGDLLCHFDVGAREANLLRARAQQAQANLDFEAATKLQNDGYTSDTRVLITKAQRDAAAAAVIAAEIDLDRTRIVAPFSGIIDELNAEIGDFLGVGKACVTLASYDPISIVGDVSVRDVAVLKPGMTARARLVTGQNVEGRIRFISHLANPKTRTFRVEMDVPNPDHAIRDGVSAELSIILPLIRAHALSPVVMILDDLGRIGVHLVDEQRIVRFIPVTIMKNMPEEIWVTGLPEKARIITVGQDYVKDGAFVNPIDDWKEKS